MNTLDNKWSSLSQQQKADIIRVAIHNGINTLPEIREAYNKFAEGGPERSYKDWSSKLSSYWNEDLSTHDYNYEKYYNDNPEEAYNQLNSILAGGHGHFPDGGENGTYKLPSHPTYPDLGEESWSNNDTVFHISDRQLDGNTDRLLNYLGEDLDYNNGGTKVMYEDYNLLPSIQVVSKKDNPNFTEAYPGLVPNKYHTGWVYEDSPVRADSFSLGGNLFGGGGDKSSKKPSASERAMSYLMSRGMSKTGASAIVGTLRAESNLDPTIHAKMKGDSGEGLAQWTGSRKKVFWSTLESIEPGAQKKYGSIDRVPFERQLDVVMAERPDVTRAINTAADVGTATDIMLRGYENGSGTYKSMATKQQMDNIYGKWNNGYNNQMKRRLGFASDLLGTKFDPSSFGASQDFYNGIDAQIALPQMYGTDDSIPDPESVYKAPTLDETLFRTPKVEIPEVVYDPRQEKIDGITRFNTVMGLMGQSTPFSGLVGSGSSSLLDAVGKIYS
jgi:hypothetical protein